MYSLDSEASILPRKMSEALKGGVLAVGGLGASRHSYLNSVNQSVLVLVVIVYMSRRLPKEQTLLLLKLVVNLIVETYGPKKAHDLHGPLEIIGGSGEIRTHG